jgi:hypothetical protein
VRCGPESPSSILVDWDLEGMKGRMSTEEEEGVRLEKGKPPLRAKEGDEL